MLLNAKLVGILFAPGVGRDHMAILIALIFVTGRKLLKIRLILLSFSILGSVLIVKRQLKDLQGAIIWYVNVNNNSVMFVVRSGYQNIAHIPINPVQSISKSKLLMSKEKREKKIRVFTLRKFMRERKSWIQLIKK